MTEAVRTVAIIGGGFCGTMTAVHLLKSEAPFLISGQPDRLRIVLIDWKEIGRGLAYGTADPKHLLNVPAGGMSAFDSEPNGFVDYLRGRFGSASPNEFASRYIYGDYLQQTLREAVSKKAGSIEFSTLNARVVDVQDDGEKRKVVLLDGSALLVDKIVLALGNAKPAKLDLFDGARYIDDPWCDGLVERIDWQQPILLIGSGLTAVDMVVKLSAHGFKQKIYAVSRHGLQPIAHRGLMGKLDAIDLPKLRDDEPFSLSKIVSLLRRQAAEIVANGRDWRDVIAALRSIFPQLWRELPLVERKRFLRHASAYWDVHRHRLAPSVAASFQDAILSHRLTIFAGRISALKEREESIDAIVRPRSQQKDLRLQIGTVINCTGPSANLANVEDDLIANLLRRGFFKQDELKLGIEIEDSYALSALSNSIFYVGPWLKAKFWEATAVPELRAHVKNTADSVIAAFSRAQKIFESPIEEETA